MLPRVLQRKTSVDEEKHVDWLEAQVHQIEEMRIRAVSVDADGRRVENARLRHGFSA